MTATRTDENAGLAGPGAGSREPRRPLDELRSISNQLWYEYWMLRCTARASHEHAAVASACEESFALHLRNLHSFLYRDDASDAVSALDFLGRRWLELRPSPTHLLAEIVTWANRVLDESRAGAPAAPRFFGLLEASFELQKVMDLFVSNLPRECLGVRWQIHYDEATV